MSRTILRLLNIILVEKEFQVSLRHLLSGYVNQCSLLKCFIEMLIKTDTLAQWNNTTTINSLNIYWTSEIKSHRN